MLVGLARRRSEGLIAWASEFFNRLT